MGSSRTSAKTAHDQVPCGAIVLHPADTVATALGDLHVGEPLRVRDAAGNDLGTATAEGLIPAFHKLALLPHAPGASVIKYGEPIGIAAAAIRPGEHVHTHNLRSLRGEGPTREGRDSCEGDEGESPRIIASPRETR